MTPLRAILVIGVLVANAAHAEEAIGRLFLSPEERRALDALRDSNAPAGVLGQMTDALPTRAPAPLTVVLNGVVSRSHGAEVVWVNGTRATAAGDQPVHLRGGPDQSNRVTLEVADGTVARLKPGQFWVPATGQVADCFGCNLAPKATDPTDTSLETPPASAAIPPSDEPAAAEP